MTLRDLTDKQLVRLWFRVHDRINRVYAGGLSFGLDGPTFASVTPGLYRAYRDVRAEGRRRGL